MKWSTLSVLFLFVIGGFAVHAGPITKVPFTITKPGKYTLLKNLTPAANAKSASGVAITIKASNVELDLGGFSIVANPAAPQVNNGISIDASAKGVRVRNGRISGFRFGFYADVGSEDVTLQSLEISSFESCVNIFAKRFNIQDCALTFSATTGTAVQLASGEGVFSHAVENCRFFTTEKGGTNQAIRVVGSDCSTTIRRCSFFSFGKGVAGNGQTLIADNLFPNCGVVQTDCTLVGYNQ